MENHLSTVLTYIDGPEDILKDKYSVVSSELKLNNDFLNYFTCAYHEIGDEKELYKKKKKKKKRRKKKTKKENRGTRSQSQEGAKRRRS